MDPSTSARCRAVLLAAIVAGTIDLGYAVLWTTSHGGSAFKLLQAIASGWTGSAAFDGGVASAALGVASHYGIILVAALLYQQVALRYPWLRTHAVTAGLLYGLAIYGVMNIVVVPLSAAPFKLHYHFWATVGDLASHLFGVGLTISLITGEVRRERSTRPF